jgi:hypothetical protein
MSAPVHFDATHLSAPEAHRSSRASPWRPKAQGRSEMFRIGTVIEGARSCDNAAVAMRLVALLFGTLASRHQLIRLFFQSWWKISASKNQGADLL